MTLKVCGYDPVRKADVVKAAEDIWNFDNWWDQKEAASGKDVLCGCGQGNLVGGEEEADFAERLAEAVWKVNGSFCEVTVDATALESIPYDTFVFDEEEYKKMQRT